VAVHQTALYDLLSAALLFGVLLLERQPPATAADPDDGAPDRQGLTES